MLPWEKYAQEQVPGQQDDLKPWEKYAQAGQPEARAMSVGGYNIPNPLTIASNIPSSAYNVGSGVVQAVSHPIETAKNVYNAGVGGIWDQLVEDYGGWNRIVDSIETDPVGTALTFSGAGGAVGVGAKVTSIAAKLGGAATLAEKAGKVASTANKISRATDPILGVKKLLVGGANATGSLVGQALGATTGTSSGGIAIKAAADAGKQSAYTGKTSRVVAKAISDGLDSVPGGRSFKEGVKFIGNSDPARAIKKYWKTPESGGGNSDDIVRSARGSVEQIRNDFKGEYVEGMKPINADPTPINHRIIKAAIDKASEFNQRVPHGPGKITKDETVGKVIKQARGLYKSFIKDGRGHHNMRGLNGFKRRVGGLMDKYEKGTAEYNAANNILQEVKTAVNNVNQEYKTILKNYDIAWDDLDDLSRTLSLKDGATMDTAFRKLIQSIRGNLHGGAGSRYGKLQKLIENGSPDLLYELAGASTNRYVKNSMQTNFGNAGVAGLVATGTLGPMFLLTAASFSPKLSALAAYATGKGSGLIMRPLVAVQKAGNNIKKMGARRLGVPDAADLLTRRGAVQTAAIADRFGEQNENEESATGLPNSEEWAQALSQASKAQGQGVHDKTIERVSNFLGSDDPEVFLRGLEILAHNKRLSGLVDDIAKGE